MLSVDAYAQCGMAKFRRRSARRAFSLVELVVVMLVIGILAVLVMEKFAGMPSTHTRMAGNELRSHLRYIHNLAMDRERATRVIFSVASNNYTVWYDTTGTGSFVRAKDPATQKDFTVNISDRFPGVELARARIGSSLYESTLYFSETNGIPCDGDGAPLTNNGVITFKNSSIRVKIIPVTGYVNLTE